MSHGRRSQHHVGIFFIESQLVFHRVWFIAGLFLSNGGPEVAEAKAATALAPHRLR